MNKKYSSKIARLFQCPPESPVFKGLGEDLGYTDFYSLLRKKDLPVIVF
jgi:hypothetical protein